LIRAVFDQDDPTASVHQYLFIEIEQQPHLRPGQPQVGPEDDPSLVATLSALVQALTVHTDVGGLARWLMGGASSPDELDDGLDPLVWIAGRATPSGLLPEQLDPFAGEQLSVTPLVWSHAAKVTAVHDYLSRRDAFAACPTCGKTRQPPLERALR
jgi:hypothetical protein